MSAADQVVTQRAPSRGIFRCFGRPRSWKLFALPRLLVVYVFAIIAADLSLTGWAIAVTPVRGGDLALFAARLAWGPVCRGAPGRRGPPTGVSRDLLSAWWLPIALLLPPVYAQLAPIILGALLYLRVRRTPAYRRLFRFGGARAGRCVGIVHLPAPGPDRRSGPLGAVAGPRRGPRLVPAAHRGAGRAGLRGLVQRAQHRHRRGGRARRPAGDPLGRGAVGPGEPAAGPDRDLCRRDGGGLLRAEPAAAAGRAAAGDRPAAQPDAPAAAGR